VCDARGLVNKNRKGKNERTAESAARLIGAGNEAIQFLQAMAGKRSLIHEEEVRIGSTVGGSRFFDIDDGL
jgi:hypothetical protein